MKANPSQQHRTMRGRAVERIQHLESENSPLNYDNLHRSLHFSGSSSVKWLQLKEILIRSLGSPIPKNDFIGFDLMGKLGLAQSGLALLHIRIAHCLHACLFTCYLRICPSFVLPSLNCLSSLNHRTQTPWGQVQWCFIFVFLDRS